MDEINTFTQLRDAIKKAKRIMVTTAVAGDNYYFQISKAAALRAFPATKVVGGKDDFYEQTPWYDEDDDTLWIG
jgi:hypothetical protein